jgi:MFS family permease
MRFECEITPLFAASVMAFFIYLGHFMRVPIVPLYAKDYGASLTQVGFITSAYMLTSSLLAVPLGLTSDWLGRKRLIIYGSLIGALASFFMVLATNPYQILAVYALAGLGLAAYAPAISAFIGDISEVSRLGRAYGAYTTTIQVAMASGPAVGGFAADLVGYSNAFIWSGVIISVGVAIAAIAFPSNLKKISRPTKRDVAAGFEMLMKNKVVIACWVAVFSLTFTWGVSPAFLPLYATGVGLSAFAIGLLFAAQSAANAVARLPFGALYDRVGKRLPFIIAGLLTAALSIALLTSFTSLAILMALMGLFGLAMGVTGMSASALVAEATKPESRGLAMGVLSACMYGGMGVSPAVLGQVISMHGFQLGFYIAAATGCVGSLLVYALTRKS